jgi:hypothetical protein
MEHCPVAGNGQRTERKLPVEYEVTVPERYPGDPEIVIAISAMGGGTVGKTYRDNRWEYAVKVNGDVLITGDDLRSGGMASGHAWMARTLAIFLSAAGESLRYSGDSSDYAGEYTGKVREFLEAEYERLSLFGLE